MKLDKKQTALLIDVNAKTAANEPYFSTKKIMEALTKAGYVMFDENTKDGNKIGFGTTSAGKYFLGGLTPTETNSAAAVRPTFELETGFTPPPVKRGGARQSTYPFDRMEVGMSFFIPATSNMPEPAKKLASTVSSATKRYMANPADRRKFVVRPGEKNGQPGARVHRVEVTDKDIADFGKPRKPRTPKTAPTA